VLGILLGVAAQLLLVTRILFEAGTAWPVPAIGLSAACRPFKRTSASGEEPTTVSPPSSQKYM
jgi:hypothetical protein